MRHRLIEPAGALLFSLNICAGAAEIPEALQSKEAVNILIYNRLPLTLSAVLQLDSFLDILAEINLALETFFTFVCVIGLHGRATERT